jgi:hypothetical protein
VKTVLSILVIIGLLVLVGFFWKDVIPTGADFLSVIIGAVFAWYMFWALVSIVFG